MLTAIIIYIPTYIFYRVKGLSCPDFEPGEICPDPGPCPYGTAPDMCYQCDECAKVCKNKRARKYTPQTAK